MRRGGEACVEDGVTSFPRTPPASGEFHHLPGDQPFLAAQIIPSPQTISRTGQ